MRKSIFSIAFLFIFLVGIGLACPPEPPPSGDVDVDVDQSVEVNQNIAVHTMRQHPDVVQPYHQYGFPDMPGHRGLHNDVWLFPSKITMAQAEALEMDEGYLWGCKTTSHFVNVHSPTETIEEGWGVEFVGIITFRGNYGTKGWEAEHHAYKLAMEVGGTKFAKLSYGMEIAGKSWSFGFGSSGQFGSLWGPEEEMHGGGSAGSGTNFGTAKVRGRPFITIAVYR